MSKIVTKEKLDLMKVKAGYYSSESLSSKEQKECRKLIADGQSLPENVVFLAGEGDYFVRVIKPNPDDKFLEYAVLEHLRYLNIIKNIAITAAVLFAISVICSAIVLLAPSFGAM